MLDRSKDTLLYMQLYDYYKELILSGKMKQGARLPSIRQCASQLQVSRTTAEMAYMLLAADGYIISRPQSGYYVTGLWQEHSRRTEQKEAQTKSADRALVMQSGKKEDGENIRKDKIDFSSTSGGQESFNLDLWRRYIKSALRQGDRLITYGNPQGEEDLRQVLSDYLTRNRNVVCSAENIVIGAGFQSLLHILCPLLRDRKTIRFLDPHFKQGQAVFEDYGFCVERDRKSDADAQLIYVTPSHLNRWGDIMPVKDRFLLLQQITESGSMLIEDDYDSEFAYMNHPAQALQGLNGGKNVIYLSTFSRMLLPSIRISFMILPDELLPAYEKRRGLYNQTVSKADQIALCQYIRDGHLQSQIRKTKKMYEGKGTHFLELLKRFQTENHVKIRITQGKSGMIARIRLSDECPCDQLAQRMLSYGIRIGMLSGENENRNEIYLSCSSVPERHWEESIRILMEEILKISEKNA